MAELEALAERETEVRAEVDALIQQTKGKAYDEAVQLLRKLRDLAGHQDQEAAFQQRLNHIYSQYSRRSALLRRLRKVGLHEL